MFNFRKSIEPMKPYIPGRPIDDVKRAYNLSNVVKLASNENPYGTSPNVKQAVMASFDESARYPDGYCSKLREAVSNFYSVDAESLIFGAGTDEVIAMLGKIFIEPEDEAITGAVTFSQYAASVESMGGKMVYAAMQEHGYNLPALLWAITSKTKIIFIANPNNPTGTYFTHMEQEEFMANVPKHVVVVFDEAYQEYVRSTNYPDTWSTLKKYPNAVLLKTFSKIYGLASYRVGFGVCHPSLVAEMEKIRCPFNVSAQAQAAAIAALEDQDFIKESVYKSRQTMSLAIENLERMGLQAIPSQANFVMVDVRKDSNLVFEKLMEQGFIVRPGSAFGMDSFIRITLGTQEEMEEFFQVLRVVIR